MLLNIVLFRLQSIQMFLFIPAILGIIILITYVSSRFSESNINMTILLTAYDNEYILLNILKQ